MSDDRRRILDLLAQGKITVDDAEQLLAAVGRAHADAPPSSAASPRYLRIAIAKAASAWRPEKLVNIRVPIALVRGGMRLGAIIPALAGGDLSRRLRERGIDVDLTKLDQAQLDELIKNVGELNLDIDSGKAQVRITCE